MNDLVSKNIQIPDELKSMLSDSIYPVKCSYFISEGKSFNFTCKMSDIDKYEASKSYSVYNIYPLLRILTTRAAIMSDSLLEEIFQSHNNEICYIMNWSNVKEFLIINLENLDYIEDHALTKLLQKNKDEILSFFR